MPKPIYSTVQESPSLKANRRKLARGYAIGMALGLALILAGGYWLHSALVKQSLKTELKQLAHKEAGVHLPDLQQWAAGQRSAADVEIGLRSHRTAFYYILSSDSRLIHGNETQPELRDGVLTLIKTNQLPEGEVVFATLYPENEPGFRVALLRYPVMHQGEYLGSVYAATDVSGSLSHLDQLLITSLVLLLGLVLLASLGGWWMANRSLQPLRLALQQQREFIADASHELRAPLTVMTTALSLVKDEAGPDMDDFHQEILEDAQSETRRLSRLAEELLLLARADSGGVQVNLQDLHPATLIQSQVRLHQALARHKQLTLIRELDASVLIRADGDLLQRMLNAGLDNAFQYTPAGGRILVRLVQVGARVTLSVEDSGTGMTEQEAGQAFRRFYRADPARQRNQQGAGLGLAVVYELAALQGASVRLESGQGRGSCLTFYFSSVSKR